MVRMAEGLEGKDVIDEPEDMELGLNLVRQVPLGIVFLRIVIVTSMSFSAAAGIFLLVAGAWPLTLACIGLTAVFMFLMFFVESLAAPREDA